jgi:hypothetical protein
VSGCAHHEPCNFIFRIFRRISKRSAGSFGEALKVAGTGTGRLRRPSVTPESSRSGGTASIFRSRCRFDIRPTMRTMGNPNLDAIRGSGGEAGKAEAERFAGTLQQIADALNDGGVATARGDSWYPSNGRNVLTRG